MTSLSNTRLAMGWGFFAFIFLLSVTPFAVSAETFSGIVKRSNYKVELLTPSKRFSLFASNSLVARDLGKLSTGDYLQGYGDVRSSYISVESVDFVGLRSLIGRWQSDDDTILRIANFRQMQVFSPSRALPTSYDPPLNVEYAITPQDSTFWSILMNTRSEVQTGAVRIDDDQFTLIVHGSNQERDEVVFRRIEDE
jgi:hypothetical protein